MNEEQQEEAVRTVVGEFSDVKHVRGTLSMRRYSDPDSASSSFSIVLGDAPRFDGQYPIFGRVTEGNEILQKLEQLPTLREGIFVMENLILKQRLAVSVIESERQIIRSSVLDILSGST